VCSVVVACAACSFHSEPAVPCGDAAVPDAPRPIDAGSGSGSAACTPRLGSACGGTLWATDFTTDPTTLDINCDGVADWAVRGGSAFPTGQLADGMWQSPSPSSPLDTNPAQPFTTHVVIDTSLQSTQAPTPGGYGAVFWLNFAYGSDGSFAVVFADVELQSDNTQTLYLYTKTDPATAMQLASVTGLGSGLIPVRLDIDPTALTVGYALGGSGISGSQGVPRIGVASTDQWATVVAYSAAANLGPTSVEVCPE
jgi:hypothetical protein